MIIYEIIGMVMTNLAKYKIINPDGYTNNTKYDADRGSVIENITIEFTNDTNATFEGTYVDIYVQNNRFSIALSKNSVTIEYHNEDYLKFAPLRLTCTTATLNTELKSFISIIANSFMR